MLRLISSWSTKLLNLSQFTCRLLPRRTNRLYLQHSHCVSGIPENTKWCIWLHDPTLPEFRKQGSSFFFLSEQPPPLNSASTFISSCCSVLKYHLWEAILPRCSSAHKQTWVCPSWRMTLLGFHAALCEFQIRTHFPSGSWRPFFLHLIPLLISFLLVPL